MNGTAHVYSGERTYEAINEWVNTYVIHTGYHLSLSIAYLTIFSLISTSAAYLAEKARLKEEKRLAKEASKADKEKVRLCG